MRAAKKLRELLGQEKLIRSLGAHDVFSALLMQQAGLKMVFLGGFGTAASMLGIPDVGQITLTEMADAVRRMASRLDIPVIADGDTGHGDLQNVQRTVQLFEQAGAAGMLLEDQVTPKRCGHFQGKQLIPCDEMVLKLKLAQQTRIDPDLVIIARTDARAVEGFQGAIDRANAYGEAGADICFIEAPESIEEVQQIPKLVPYPLLLNHLIGGVTPILSCEEVEQLGYKIVVFPIASLLSTGKAFQKIIHAVMEEGRIDQLQAEMLSFDEVKQLLGLPELLSLRSRLIDDRLIDEANK